MSILLVNEIKSGDNEPSIALTELGYRVIKNYRQTYTAGQWNPDNVYNWVPGMFFDYTPSSEASRIRVYCHLSYVGLNAAHGISHWIFYANGVERGRHNISGNHLEDNSCYTWDFPSWGTTAGRIGYQMRSYANDNNEVRPYTTRYWDGAVSNQNCIGQFIIEEYLPITIPQPVYTVFPDVTLIGEGSSVIYTVETFNVPDGTILYWTNSGNTDSDDFTDLTNSGSVTINGGIGSIVRTVSADATPEGTETIILQIRTGSTSGTIVATAETVNVLNVIVTGQAEFTSAGTFSWTAPAGVISVSVVCVGGGGGPAANTSGASGGGGGGLGWKNNIPVVPGQSYTVQVGAGGTRTTSGTAGAGGQSFFINAATVAGNGGGGGVTASNTGGAGGTFVGDGGGNGGNGGGRNGSTAQAGGGGGAGGYSGAGGNGSNGTNNATGSAGSGGGGGGGGGCGTVDTGGSGGGVGLLGEGASGAKGASTTADGRGGFGGSSGTDAFSASTSTTAVNVYGTGVNQSAPGLRGGGGSGSDNPTVAEQANGGNGGVRIIWGENRLFPSTNTGNL